MEKIVPISKPTKTERKDIRAIVLDVLGPTEIHIGDNGDGTWFADIHGLFLEAESPGALLRELAEILEEC